MPSYCNRCWMSSTQTAPWQHCQWLCILCCHECIIACQAREVTNPIQIENLNPIFGCLADPWASNLSFELMSAQKTESTFNFALTSQEARDKNEIQRAHDYGRAEEKALCGGQLERLKAPLVGTN